MLDIYERVRDERVWENFQGDLLKYMPHSCCEYDVMNGSHENENKNDSWGGVILFKKIIKLQRVAKN